jgi:hypothetical protein
MGDGNFAEAWFKKYQGCTCGQCTMALDPFYDRALQLELAEHAYLMVNGFSWGALAGSFFWFAPLNWPGSRTSYPSRAHAINSVKRHYPNGDLHGRDHDAY